VAEILNALTEHLYGGKTLDEIYDILRRERCLSPVGIERRAQVIAVAVDAEAEWRRDDERGVVGGTREYRIAFTLMSKGYLNARAKKLFNKITYKQPGASA